MLVNDPGRRVASGRQAGQITWLGHSASPGDDPRAPDDFGPHPVTSSRGSAEVFRTDGVQEFAKLFDLVFLLVRDRYPGLIQDFLGGED